MIDFLILELDQPAYLDRHADFLFITDSRLLYLKFLPRGESDFSEMVTFMNMVITGVENWFPDMIPVFVDLIYFILFNIGELTADTKTQKGS